MCLTFQTRVQSVTKYTLQACVLYGISLLTIEKFLMRYIFKNFLHSRNELSNRLFSTFNAFVQLYCFYKFKKSKRGYSQKTADLALKEPSKYGHWKDVKEIKYASPLLAYLIIDTIHLALIKDPNLLTWVAHHLFTLIPLLSSILTDQFFGVNVICAGAEFISIPLFIAWMNERYFPNHRKKHAFFKCLFAVVYLKLRTYRVSSMLAHAIYYGLQDQNSLGIEKRDQRSQITRYFVSCCCLPLLLLQFLWTFKALMLAKKAIQGCL